MPYMKSVLWLCNLQFLLRFKIVKNLEILCFSVATLVPQFEIFEKNGNSPFVNPTNQALYFKIRAAKAHRIKGMLVRSTKIRLFSASSKFSHICCAYTAFQNGMYYCHSELTYVQFLTQKQGVSFHKFLIN